MEERRRRIKYFMENRKQEEILFLKITKNIFLKTMEERRRIKNIFFLKNENRKKYFF